MMIKLFLKKCNTKSLKTFIQLVKVFLDGLCMSLFLPISLIFFYFCIYFFFLLDLYFHSAETFVRKNFLSVYFEFETIKQEVFLCLYRLVLADFQSER